jgi:hypothetical protein
VFAVSKLDGERVRFLFVTGDRAKGSKAAGKGKAASKEEAIRAKATPVVGTTEKKGNGKTMPTKSNGNGHKSSAEADKIRAKLAGKNPVVTKKREKLAELTV